VIAGSAGGVTGLRGNFDPALDVTGEPRFARPAGRVGPPTDCAGVLHSAARGMQPERSLRDIGTDDPAHAFAVYTTGALLPARAFAPLPPKRGPRDGWPGNTCRRRSAAQAPAPTAAPSPGTARSSPADASRARRSVVVCAPRRTVPAP